ncbi:AAA family ATPase [candidate division KSB1 bacterium]|nr:AAA family ATPase [candidate division KSB1 bacterium]
MNKATDFMNVGISAEFLKAFANIPKNQQYKVREFISKFRTNPQSGSIHYEKIQDARDANLHSVRIDQTYRGIVLKPDTGNLYMLLWVDHHDRAYEWARNKVVQIHPETGGLQIFDVTKARAFPQETTVKKQIGLYQKYKDRELLKIGVPKILLPLVRSLETDENLEQIADYLPQEAYEALFMLAAGYSLQEIMYAIDQQKEIDPNDFIKALDNPDSLRRFYLVEEAKDLDQLLNSPLELWRVFLHPYQKKIVEINANGPVRVLGGAGTGKTVVAMHRAKWLIENIFVQRYDKILFTTFTRNLAEDIKSNLAKICRPDDLKRIDVVNLDKWVSQFLQQHDYKYHLVFDRDTRDLWNNALNLAPADPDLDETFYKDEWYSVIQHHGISSIGEYIRVPRIGRSKRLNRQTRQKIWPVFEEYRSLLDKNHYKEPIDVTRDAQILLESKGDILPYRAVIVDEAQDMNPESFKLIRQMVPQQSVNDIFIVGDAHQRIYENKVVLGRCGIDIRGRGRKLRINYRTTEETRRFAVNILRGVEFDDLDGELDTQKGYKSLTHGLQPSVKFFESFAQEVEFIYDYLREQNTDLKNLCLVARTNNLLAQYEGALKSRGLEIYLINRDEAENREKDGLRIATMHRVKGLEFDHIIIASTNKGIIPLFEDEKDSDRAVLEKSLLYVAVTRARKSVLITGYGEMSEFLMDEKRKTG